MTRAPTAARWNGSASGAAWCTPRAPSPITGFDDGDDLPLERLGVGAAPPPGTETDPERERTYWGPYLLVNTALNLVKGEELAWQERKAESFVLSPGFCGSAST